MGLERREPKDGLKMASWLKRVPTGNWFRLTLLDK
jgi:hypothetical protein